MLNVHFACEKCIPFLSFILFVINSKSSKGLCLIQMSAFNCISREFFHSFFSFLLICLNIENWVRENRFNNLSFLILKDRLKLRIRFQNRINDVSFIKAISHINSSFEDFTYLLIRQSNCYFRWIKLFYSLSFLLFLCILVDLSLLFNFYCPHFLENSFYLICKGTLLIFYLLNQSFDM